MDDNFVDAYVIATGEKQRIPRHWLDHPTLGAPFRLTPKAAAKQRRAAETADPADAEPTDTDATDPATQVEPEEPALDTSTTGDAEPDGTDHPDPAAEPKE